MLLAALLAATLAAPPTEDAPMSYAEQAPLDVDTILEDSSKPYLEARARLVAHPKEAAEALHDRLTAVPAPGPAERKRLLDVLAEIGRPEDLDLFAAELKKAVLNAEASGKELAAAEVWRHLLRDQGAAGAKHYQVLIGDKDLPDTVRAMLVQDLVDITAAAELGGLVALVGRGQAALQDELRRGLQRRVARDLAGRSSVIAATDAALDQALGDPPVAAEAKRLPALLRFRAAVSGGEDPEVTARLVGVATDDDARFGARVAALRGLGAMKDRRAADTLTSVARAQLSGDRRRTQAGEILGWIALRHVDAKTAATLAQELALLDDDAPRLASVGWEFVPLPRGHAWLARGMANPWPQVRQAALERVEGPCDRTVVGELAKLGGPSSKADDDRRVARAAIVALGKCGGDTALASLGRLLENSRMDIELRAEAGRQLAKRGGAWGANKLADALTKESDARLARRLASALKFVSPVTPEVDRVLCENVQEPGGVGAAAVTSLKALHPDVRNPCEASS
jgi:hypothetical protein